MEVFGLTVRPFKNLVAHAQLSSVLLGVFCVIKLTDRVLLGCKGNNFVII